MTDYIKREDLLDLYDLGDLEVENAKVPLNVVIQNIKDMPSADVVERKKGEWIKLYAGNYKCSICGDWWSNDDNEMVEDFKYCPNCGADMREEENSNDNK